MANPEAAATQEVSPIDKILKESQEALNGLLAEKLLAIPFDRLEDTPLDLQRTLERKPDYLQKVYLKDKLSHILHVEYQSTNDANMVYRMYVYHALLCEKFRVPVQQHVIYMGNKALNMKNELVNDADHVFRYHLHDIRSYPSGVFLEAADPDIVLLALLGGHSPKERQQLIATILGRLFELIPQELVLRKQLHKLKIIAKLRDAQAQVTEQIKRMPITIDITDSPDYLEGVSQGKVEGREEGREEGIALTLAIMDALKANDLSPEDIAAKYQVQPSRVLELKKHMGL